MATTSVPMSTLMALTRKYINEYVSTEDDFATETDELLKAHILAAAKQVAAVAPENLVCVGAAASTKTEQRPDGMYYTITPIPENCLKVVTVTSTDWKRPVVDILPITHPNAGREYSTIAGIGSGAYSPRVYKMGDMLYAHASESSKFGTTTSFVLEPDYDSTGNSITNIKPGTAEAVSYLAAALYLGSIGDGNAQAATSAASSIIQGWIAGDVRPITPATQAQEPQQ